MADPSESVSSSFEMVSAVHLTVTSPTGGPRDTVLGIQMAEIWRGCKVEEISGSGGFHLGVPREQGCSGSYTSQTDLRGRKSTADGAGRSRRVFQSVACTSVAPSKRSFSTMPTRLNGGITFQQVLSSQDPDTP